MSLGSGVMMWAFVGHRNGDDDDDDGDGLGLHMMDDDILCM